MTLPLISRTVAATLLISRFSMIMLGAFGPECIRMPMGQSVILESARRQHSMYSGEGGGNLSRTDNRYGSDTLAINASNTADVEADSTTVDLDALPVEAPVPDHLDSSEAVLKLQINSGVLLRA